MRANAFYRSLAIPRETEAINPTNIIRLIILFYELLLTQSKTPDSASTRLVTHVPTHKLTWIDRFVQQQQATASSKQSEETASIGSSHFSIERISKHRFSDVLHKEIVLLSVTFLTKVRLVNVQHSRPAKSIQLCHWHLKRKRTWTQRKSSNEFSFDQEKEKIVTSMKSSFVWILRRRTQWK